MSYGPAAYSRRKRAGIIIVSLLMVIIGFLISIGVYVLSTASLLGLLLAVVVFIASIIAARVTFMMGVHGRRPKIF